MAKLKFVFCIVVLIMFAGCTGVSKVRYSLLLDVNRPAHSIEEVEVFLTKVPTLPYKEIGIMTYRAGTAETYGSVVQYLLEKAAELGADGIIMMDSKAGPGMMIGYTFATLTDYKAMAIVYKK